MDALRLVPAAPEAPRTPYLPPEAPLAMPVQSLKGEMRAPRLALQPQSILLRRLFVFGVAFALSAVAAWQMYLVLAVGGLTVLEGVILALFVILFAWIALSFASLLGGVVALATGQVRSLGIDPDAPLPAIEKQTALLFPTYNEDPDRVLARVQAIYESVAATGNIDRFDVFILSDTTDPDTFIAEEAAFLALARAPRRRGAAVLPAPPEERRQEGRQHRRMAAALRRTLRAHGRARCRLADDRRHAGAACRRDGAQSRRRADPDLPRDGQRHDAVRARAAIRRPALRTADRLRHCMVARNGQQLLGPQRHHPHACFRRKSPDCRCSAGAVRSAGISSATISSRPR